MSGEGERLAEDEFDGADGGDEDLLHRADFLFADDGHAGEHEGDEGDEGGDDAGDVEVSAFEVGVEPGAGVEADLGERLEAALGAGEAIEEDAAAVLFGDAGGVGESDAGGIGVGAVDDDLEGGGMAAAEGLGEAFVDDDGGADAAAVQQIGDGGVVGDVCHDIEEVGGGEAGQEVAAFGGVVAVEDGQADMADVGRDGVAEDDDLEDGHGEDDAFHPRVAQDLAELLLEHLDEPFEHGRPHSSFLRKRTLARVTMSAAKTVRRRISGPEDAEADAFEVDAARGERRSSGRGSCR